MITFAFEYNLEKLNIRFCSKEREDFLMSHVEYFCSKERDDILTHT